MLEAIEASLSADQLCRCDNVSQFLMHFLLENILISVEIFEATRIKTVTVVITKCSLLMPEVKEMENKSEKNLLVCTVQSLILNFLQTRGEPD